MKKNIQTGIHLPDVCFCNEPCQPLAQIVADNKKSYLTVCIRKNKGKTKRDRDDKYVVRFKNDSIDDISYYDERDLIDTVSVFAQVLSIIENMRENKLDLRKLIT